jgi:acyl dehydratase
VTADTAQVTVGTNLPEFVDAPLTRTDFVRYQGASGDMNPLHHDDERARAAGFPSVYAVGMLAAGVLGSWVADQFGPENVRRLAVRFREQAWPGDVLTYRGTVVDCRTGADGERLLDLELRVTRQTGADHLVGEATVVVGAPTS